MFQTDQPTAVSSLPTPAAAGTQGYFTNGNPATGTPATILDADFMNMVMMELLNIVTAGGLTPSKTTNNQVITAIKTLMQQSAPTIAVDTGTANTYVIAFTPAWSAPVPWAPFWFKVKTANNGASTLNATGTAYGLVGGGHQALQGGELVANGNALAYWNPTLNGGAGQYVLVLCSGAAEQVAPATQPTHAAQMGQLQTQAGTAFTTGGTAPSFTLTPSPAITAYATSQRFSVTFNAAGTTGSNTLNIGGLGAKNLKQYDSNGAKQPAVIPASGWSSDVVYDGTDLVVLDPVIQSSSVVGVARNVSINMLAAGTSMTITADEIVAKTALGGMPYINVNVNDTINSATTGAGGMDTGSAPTNGYVAIYRIYNPTTNTWKWLGWNATSAIAPNIYGGANMPSGYTASALVSVWPTNGSGQFVVGSQDDRVISIPPVQVLNAATIYAAGSTLSIAGAVPKNAKSISGSLIATSSSTSTMNLLVSGGAQRTGEQGVTFNGVSTGCAYSGVRMVTAQTIGLLTSSTAGTPNFAIYVSSYGF